MLRQRRSPFRLIVAAALVAAGACGDQRAPTVPLAASDAPSEISSGGGGTRVKLKSLQLSANTLRIDGPAVTAALTLGNPGLAYQAGISLRAEVVQGAVTRRAFDVPTQCLPGDAAGFLPNGECSMSVPASVSNSATGVGTLAPGSAEFVVHVLNATDAGEVELATKSVTVNLVATPSISALSLASTTLAIDGPLTNYTATLQNPAKSLQGVALQGTIVQGTTRRAAGGVQVTCGSNIGVLPPGTCTINFAAVVSSIGTGTLSPGPATFELSLFQIAGGVQTTFDTESVAITLVSSSPVISSLVLDATSLVIGGASVNYTVQLQNFGFPASNIALQGEIVQGAVLRGAGGFSVDCGAGLGKLPTTASCSMRLTAAALGDAAGGVLSPGAASFVLHLYKENDDGTTSELDTRTVAVALRASTPTFTSVTPASSYVALEGAAGSYSAAIDNPGTELSDVVLQAWIRQGTARRAAAGAQISCNGGPRSILPVGNCIALGDIVASNNPIVSGDGTLAVGPATLEVELIVGSTIVDTRTVPITLVPNTPSIVSLELDPSSAPIGGSTHFNATVYNPGTSTLSGVSLQGYITQGSVEAPAGGLSVTCPVTGAAGSVVPGACNVRFTVNPSNAFATGGVLVAGPAQYVLKLSVGGAVLDTKSVPITLTTP